MSVIIYSRITNLKHEVKQYSLIWPSSVDIEERISGTISDLKEGNIFTIEYDGAVKNFKLKKVMDKGTKDEIVYFVAPKED